MLLTWCCLCKTLHYHVETLENEYKHLSPPAREYVLPCIRFKRMLSSASAEDQNNAADKTMEWKEQWSVSDPLFHSGSGRGYQRCYFPDKISIMNGAMDNAWKTALFVKFLVLRRATTTKRNPLVVRWLCL